MWHGDGATNEMRGLYSDPHGWTGDKVNISKIILISSFLKALAVPFILFGDFNILSTRLEIAARLDDCIVKEPTNAPFTCNAGPGRVS